MFDKIHKSFLLGLVVCFVSVHGPGLVSCSSAVGSNKTEYLRALQIVNGVTRGTSYTDEEGMSFNLRYIPVSMKNDSTAPAHIQLEFASEYEYPVEFGGGVFRVLILPQEWAQDGTPDSMFTMMWKDFGDHLKSPGLSKVIKPGQEITFAVASLYPLPADRGWIVPRGVRIESDSSNGNCDWLVKPENKARDRASLVVELTHNQGCKTIRCGTVGY